MGAVVSFFRPASKNLGGWSQQELAEFYRVEAALIRAGLPIGSEQGLSDEAEPWFVFCRPDGDAIMHFARIDGSYVIASDVLDSPIRGSDFRALIDQVAQLYPKLLPIPRNSDGTKLSVHPAALLAALVAAAALILSPDDAFADEAEHASNGSVPNGQAGLFNQQSQARTGGPSDLNERDTHRKQLDAVVFSALIFGASALFADHAEAEVRPELILGSLAGISTPQGAPDGPSSSNSAEGTARAVTSGAPLMSGASGHLGGTSPSSATSEPMGIGVSQQGNLYSGTIGLEHATPAHGQTHANPEAEYQALASAVEARPSRGAGPSSAAAGPDTGTTSSSAAEVTGLVKASPLATGDIASEGYSKAATQSTHEAASAHAQAIQPTLQSDAGIAAADHRGGAGDDYGSKAAHVASSAGTSQAETRATDASHGQGSGGPSKNAEAPGHLKDASSSDQGAEVADAFSASGTSQGGAQAIDTNPTAPQTDKPSAAGGQVVHSNGQGQANPLAASVDAAGNLVFSSDSQHGTAPSWSHAPEDIGSHTDVGLVGISDHGNITHHFDLHS